MKGRKETLIVVGIAAYSVSEFFAFWQSRFSFLAIVLVAHILDASFRIRRQRTDELLQRWTLVREIFLLNAVGCGISFLVLSVATGSYSVEHFLRGTLGTPPGSHDFLLFAFAYYGLVGGISAVVACGIDWSLKS